MSSYPWDYIDQMNGLLDSKLEGLTPSELYLYMKLFQINNSKHRVEWFELKNRMLSAFIDKDEKSMIRLRNSLQQKGLIEFRAGKKGQPSEYNLVLLYGRKNTGKNASKNASTFASENASKNASICASKSASEKVSEPQCLCGSAAPLKGKGKEKGKKKNTSYSKKSDPKTNFAEAVAMTNAEYEALMEKLGSKDAVSWCIDKLNNYKLSSGRTYKSDYRAMLSWVIDEYQKTGIRKKPEPVSRSESGIDWSVYDG